MPRCSHRWCRRRPSLHMEAPVYFISFCGNPDDYGDYDLCDPDNYVMFLRFLPLQALFYLCCVLSKECAVGLLAISCLFVWSDQFPCEQVCPPLPMGFTDCASLFPLVQPFSLVFKNFLPLKPFLRRTLYVQSILPVVPFWFPFFGI